VILRLSIVVRMWWQSKMLDAASPGTEHLLLTNLQLDQLSIWDVLINAGRLPKEDSLTTEHLLSYPNRNVWCFAPEVALLQKHGFTLTKVRTSAFSNPRFHCGKQTDLEEVDFEAKFTNWRFSDDVFWWSHHCMWYSLLVHRFIEAIPSLEVDSVRTMLFKVLMDSYSYVCCMTATWPLWCGPDTRTICSRLRFRLPDSSMQLFFFHHFRCRLV
jgi:hypothetical protein